MSIYNLFSKNKRIFLDYASLGLIHPEVNRAMYLSVQKGNYNAESLYKEGVLANDVIINIQKKMWEMYSMHPDEIIFTESGTLSNNLALQGVVKTAIKKGIAKPHIIISSIEHSSVIETVKALEKSGDITVDYIEIDDSGELDTKEFKKMLRDETVLVSCMLVNNETGLVLPVNEIIKIIRHYRKEHNGVYPYIHSDCAQAMYQDIDMRRFHVDFATFSASKMFGGQGVSVLYKRRGVTIHPLVYGGDGKELWAGTKNTVALIGFQKTLSLWEKNKVLWVQNSEMLCNYLLQSLLVLRENFPKLKIISCSERDKNSPHIFSFGYMGASGERLVLMLDAKGVMVSSRSACKTNDEGVSHVIESFYKNNQRDYKNMGVVRVSFGFNSTKKDIDVCIEKFREVIKLLELEVSLLE